MFFDAILGPRFELFEVPTGLGHADDRAREFAALC